jgi:hypothetical protein
MNDYSERPISGAELREKYDVYHVSQKTTGYWHKFMLADTNSRETYTGTLYWNEHDGLEILWEQAPPIDYKREDFAYWIDKIVDWRQK